MLDLFTPLLGWFVSDRRKIRTRLVQLARQFDLFAGRTRFPEVTLFPKKLGSDGKLVPTGRVAGGTTLTLHAP